MLLLELVPERCAAACSSPRYARARHVHGRCRSRPPPGAPRGCRRGRTARPDSPAARLVIGRRRAIERQLLVGAAADRRGSRAHRVPRRQRAAVAGRHRRRDRLDAAESRGTRDPGRGGVAVDGAPHQRRWRHGCRRASTQSVTAVAASLMRPRPRCVGAQPEAELVLRLAHADHADHAARRRRAPDRPGALAAARPRLGHVRSDGILGVGPRVGPRRASGTGRTADPGSTRSRARRRRGGARRA